MKSMEHFLRKLSENLSLQLLARWYIACACLLLGTTIVAQNSHAKELLNAPVLRLETGMHASAINSIATDAQHKLAVTAGSDGTVRVWQIGNGKLLQVIRPPLSFSVEDSYSIAAISPDSTTIAVGGASGLVSIGSVSMYLFSRATGKMLAQLKGLPHAVRELAFSPDGRWLAAGIKDRYGIRVWDTQNLTKSLRDLENEDEIVGLAWSRDGKLLSAGKNGNLRLYSLIEGKLELLKSANVKNEDMPSAIAFAPDGKNFALAYSNRAKVDVLATASLTPVFTANMQGVQDGVLHLVAWSHDAQTLAAAGSWGKDEKVMLRRWDKAGRGAPQDSELGKDNARGLLALPNSTWLLATQFPEWGVVDAMGKWQVRAHRQRADFKDFTSTSLAINDDAKKVQFSFEADGAAPFHFDLESRTLHKGKLAQAHPPRTTGLPISSWQNSPIARFGFFSLPAQVDDVNYCLAISEDKERFIIGSAMGLRIFNGEGYQLRLLRATTEVWAVNIARNGLIFVAAYDDGSIRWQRLSDGVELLAFIPLPDRKNWILRTPSGYYDASPGALPYIGWHLNRGQDQAADYLSEARFQQRYFRPDIVNLVLQTLDEAKAISIANGKK